MRRLQYVFRCHAIAQPRLQEGEELLLAASNRAAISAFMRCLDALARACRFRLPLRVAELPCFPERSFWRSMETDRRLDQAMRLFWRKGYFDTSVEDLAACTGLNRAAIYADFGSKKKLFEALLGRYQAQITAQRLAPLRAEDAGLEELEWFFRQFRNLAARGEGRLGCLMCLTAAEVSPHLPSVARIVSAYLDELGGLFRRALINARKRGEVGPRTDAARMANYLTGAVLGLMALVRSPASRTAIAHYLDGVLSLLHNLQPKRD